MSTPLAELGEFIVKGGGSVNPAKYPNEVFHLYSIPAYDSGRPDEVEGSAIGSSKNVVQGNDVLLSRIVPHIRRGWIVGSKNGHRQIASGEWIIFRSERFDPGYLRYHLLSDEFNRKLMRTIKGVGGSLMRADPNQVARFKIPLPPLPTQRRIAAILDKAQALVANDKRTLALYDQLAKSLFLEMFGDPVRNERGWEVVKLKSCYAGLSATRCGPFGSALKKGEFVESGVPVWVMDNIAGHSFDPLERLHITPEKYNDLTHYAVKDGDIIISRAGTVGKMCVLKSGHDRSIISTNLIKLSLDESRLIPEVFVRLMTYFRGKVGNLRTGQDGAFTHMNTQVLDNLAIALPPMEVQEQYIHAIGSLEAQRIQVQKSLHQSEGLFGSLLQRAFSGNLV